MVRVFLADDDAGVRRALRMVLEREPGVRIAGETAHTHGLASLVEDAQADIVFIDWDLPHRVDAWLIAELRRLSCQPVVIVTSSHVDAQHAALAAGAAGFVDKGEPSEALRSVVQDWLGRAER